ncbi:MAG: hypothetical protein WCA24_12175 [Thiomonas sp.]
MDTEYTHERLVSLGFRLERSADLELAQWLVEQVGPAKVRAATHELTSRRRPRPKKVARELGLVVPVGSDFQQVPWSKVVQHMANGARGWAQPHASE